MTTTPIPMPNFRHPPVAGCHDPMFEIRERHFDGLHEQVNEYLARLIAPLAASFWLHAYTDPINECDVLVSGTIDRDADDETLAEVDVVVHMWGVPTAAQWDVFVAECAYAAYAALIQAGHCDGPAERFTIRSRPNV